MQNQIPNCYYRTSAKAFIINEDLGSFMLAKELNGLWSLPGGGIDFGEDPIQALKREIHEEMGLEVLSVEPKPLFYYTFKNLHNQWMANIVYKTQLKSLDFKASNECVEIKFVNKVEAMDLQLNFDVVALIKHLS